jgi:hypothetical protein
VSAQKAQEKRSAVHCGYGDVTKFSCINSLILRKAAASTAIDEKAVLSPLQWQTTTRHFKEHPCHKRDWNSYILHLAESRARVEDPLPPRGLEYYASSEVLTAVFMWLRVFWDVTPCRLINSYRRFEGTVLIRNK